MPRCKAPETLTNEAYFKVHRYLKDRNEEG